MVINGSGLISTRSELSYITFVINKSLAIQ
ncbi:hypothetical protein VCRA2120O256_170077 [Vibrio crassostreae]|nr:hypothetical protein VCHA32P90_170021 [Vibrio chagasii]CAK1778659.1 hypothetical protein VCRA2114O421_150063 [Vibrio crassostreae]CAK1780729.1 hypothetical protein VCRA2113O411_150064 [Vibrio crassostreae]CAK1790656.1 hypothetical protein VCRA2113O414_160063 [Vibrio crassostreae]CAK1807935.1 hypothetical protein VCRA2110O173_180077 [Vibrio crassostreae]